MIASYIFIQPLRTIRLLWMATIILICLALCLGWVQAGEPTGLRLQIEPTKQIYSLKEGLVVKFIFTANQKTKLCLSKDILSQMQVSISRPGQGRLALQPLVINDNSTIFQEPMRVHWLEAGQSLTLRANLKRYRFVDTDQWTSGEYTVSATFNLCEQTPSELVTDPGQEIPVKAVHPGWFMIMI